MGELLLLPANASKSPSLAFGLNITSEKGSRSFSRRPVSVTSLIYRLSHRLMHDTRVKQNLERTMLIVV
ncbi:unnamed protein product [Pleuronectes platessa]|uniref:Uncharacterized protein n=1 Tax=Pleuronectes platessa TaxID=8262 RepID=A0A9N7UJA6_PLEPL|nr:unnamed protein product [Pleuronectes platessa]